MGSNASGGSSRSRGAGTGALNIEAVERKTALRRFMAMGTVAWTSFIVTDLLAASIHGTPLTYLVALRLIGTGLGLTIYILSGISDLPTWLLHLLEGIITPLAGLLVSLAALRCGGAESPLAIGVITAAMVRGILPSPWTRGLPSALATALMFPIVVLFAAVFLPNIAAQLRIPIVQWTLAQTTLFLILAACLAAAGSHLLWSAKEQIHEARKLGSYRLVARIGSGGMGEVWLARQMPLNRRVALKILKETTLQDPAALRRFKREAEAASSLVHPHTIRVFDFGASDDGVFFIAMELLDGMDLEAIVARLGPVPPARAVHLGRQVCSSLVEAHKRGIIHCDLKPANLFVTKVGDDYDFAKVLDFGLARVAARTDETTVDSIRGTPAFMPPEVIRGEPVTAASDIYSMGAVLYWMLTGSPVFRGKGFHEAVLAHLDKTPERPSDRLGREIPTDLEAVILKCLAKEPGERYASTRQLEEALAACECASAWSSEAARASWETLRPSVGRVRSNAS